MINESSLEGHLRPILIGMSESRGRDCNAAESWGSVGQAGRLAVFVNSGDLDERNQRIRQWVQRCVGA